jgi:hypothetical protein
VRVRSPTTGWWKSLTPVSWKRTLWAAQRVRNSGALGGELTDEVGEVAVVGVVAGCLPEHGDDVASRALPVDVELAGAGLEEDVPGAVDGTGASGPAEHVRVKGVAELVGGQDVQANVENERRGAGEAVEDVLDAWPHALPGRSSTSRRAHRPEGTGEIKEVRALRLVELQGAGERFQDAVGDAEVSRASSGVIFARREIKNSRISVRGSTHQIA